MSRGAAIQLAYRLQMVRAVVGMVPAGQFVVANDTALQGLTLSLTECEQARAILRAKGWGDFGTSILDVANLIPEKAKA